VNAVRCCVWEITLACNLRCKHCGATAGRARPDELTPAEALHLADDVAALPTQEVTLMGGELFLRSDWLAIAERLRANGVALVIFTNGWLLDRERIAQIKVLSPRTVGLSLDGARAEVHDAQRGVAGSHERAWRALDALREASLPASVITTLTRSNLYELPALARQLLARGIHWQVQVATCNGARMARSDQLTPLEFYWAGAWLDLVRHKYDWPLLPVAGAHDLGYHSTRLGNLLPPGCTWNGCTAGLDTLGIQSHGGVKGCLSLPDDFVEGNVRERPIGDLWRDPDAFALNRQFTLDKLRGFCATCPYGPACRGGCSDLAHAATGSPYDNPYCFYRLEIEEEIRGPERNP
jgi:radical SAM protein with 4Fe4S-binding SPASM domain